MTAAFHPTKLFGCEAGLKIIREAFAALPGAPR